MPRKAIIIGAGPAGLTAAYELLKRTDIHPIVLEKSSYMGGISRTVEYKGNRIDIGGHRFFSKSSRVMNWWLQHLPVAEGASEDSRAMLVRPRKSRIYFLRQFFDYPIKLTADTLRKLGLTRTVKIGMSYVRSVLFPIRRVENLEQFFINRFGRQLYKTFFQSYTEKVWGVPCDKISAAWGEQRIKGLSIRKTISHFLSQRMKSKKGDFAQRGTETSLIEQFLYPKYGPGQMWEEVARKVREMGGEIITDFRVKELGVENGEITKVIGVAGDGSSQVFEGDYFFSTMPIKNLIAGLRTEVPEGVRYLGENLQYRDFLTVGLLLDELKVRDDKSKKLISDNWIYIQEPDVLAGRLQIFNNWSPHLVADPGKVWLGVEYFCYENDDLWRKPDEEMARFAIEELSRIDILEPQHVRDWTVLRMEKTYPAYFGVYERFDELRRYLDTFDNLFLIGRNGMHKYNNMDHSMLTAMIAVDNIVSGQRDKANLWAVNTEEEYHEGKGA